MALRIEKRAAARHRATQLGHRLSTWRLTPTGGEDLVETATCVQCGVSVTYRRTPRLFDTTMEGEALTQRCGVVSPSGTGVRDLYTIIADQHPGFASFMAALHGTDWRQTMTPAQSRTAAKRWMHAMAYGGETLARWDRKK